MPIANCFLKKEITVTPQLLEQIVADLSTATGVDIKDICINLVSDFYQAGQQYKVFVNLYLPSLWFPKDVNKVQLAFLETIIKHLSVTNEEVFIITSIVQPGNVVENGEIIDW